LRESFPFIKDLTEVGDFEEGCSINDDNFNSSLKFYDRLLFFNNLLVYICLRSKIKFNSVQIVNGFIDKSITDEYDLGPILSDDEIQNFLKIEVKFKLKDREKFFKLLKKYLTEETFSIKNKELLKEILYNKKDETFIIAINENPSGKECKFKKSK
jgi:hypothetical protein